MQEMTTHQDEPGELLDAVEQLCRLRSDSLSNDQLRTLREGIDQLINYHATIGVFGKTGVGKSSLCNVLFSRDIAPVSAIESCTREPQEIQLALKHGRGITLIDVPGIGESEALDTDHLKLYRSLIPKLDLILWVIKGDDRALSLDEQVYRDQVLPQAREHGVPVTFVINQVDKIEPCREWDWKKNYPGPEQARNIALKQDVVCRQFRVPLREVCIVAVEQGYGLCSLVEQVLYQLPREKRWAVHRETEKACQSPQSVQEASKALWESVRDLVVEAVHDGWVFIVRHLGPWYDRIRNRI
ncbi:GTPase family protein [Chitinimonas sp. BJYL2]|uniref:GTPase family protein n=1 Tax=Chitinimonas sp. BJYL2 TaxID=2976696 RepID=UPI0022B5BA2B|nr:GTPase [Chitinimonas sp. BJYL2]